jgi:hypothetical protein
MKASALMPATTFMAVVKDSRDARVEAQAARLIERDG